eukprot:2245289-Pyramimonas_sp.AAC.1
MLLHHWLRSRAWVDMGNPSRPWGPLRPWLVPWLLFVVKLNTFYGSTKDFQGAPSESQDRSFLPGQRGRGRSVR